MKYLHQKGDTIVEVLIAMAVLGLVLGGAYASARRSLNATIQAHEHSAALKIAEEQQERLKYLSEQSLQPPDNIYNHLYVFCFKSSDLTLSNITITFPPPIGSTGTTIMAVPLNSYSSDCVDVSGVYRIAIGRASDNVFTVYIRWNNIHGTGQDQVTLAYKLDK